jgi:hypothetical protein
MSPEKFTTILDGLKNKSSTKQNVYRITVEAFELFRQTAKDMAAELNARMHEVDPNVEVKTTDISDFEFHLKFSGDTLVFMMHTNVFSFPTDHFIPKSKYVKEDPFRGYCGLIQVYNFLSDSIKYNREGDLGYLIARLFVNKDQHFFIEGKRQLSFMFNNFEAQQITHEKVTEVLENAMSYCLDFELFTPPFETSQVITVEQKNQESYNSGNSTGKRLGFKFMTELNPNASTH